MAAGDVTVTIVAAPVSTSTIDNALTTIRTAIGAGGTWSMLSHGKNIIIAGIEEV